MARHISLNASQLLPPTTYMIRTTCSKPGVIPPMHNREVPLHASHALWFKTVRKHLSDNVLISSWRAVINNNWTIWVVKVETAAKDRLHARH